MLTPEQYAIERAICDKAQAYAAQFVQPNGWTIIPAEAAKHPDYAACDNGMRSRVETFELNRDKPATFSAYVQSSDRAHVDATNIIACRHRDVTTWTGDKLGTVTHSGAWHRNNFGGKWRQVTARMAWGDTYTGREYDSRQFVNWRRTAA